MDELKAALERIIAWTRLKCRLQITEPKHTYFNEREIWWAHLGENIGSEQNGKNEQFDRPVLIVKKFNAAMLWILPITTTNKERPYYFTVAHEDGQRQVKIILSQIRTISAKRLIRKQRMLPEVEFEEVLLQLKAML